MLNVMTCQISQVKYDKSDQVQNQVSDDTCLRLHSEWSCFQGKRKRMSKSRVYAPKWDGRLFSATAAIRSNRRRSTTQQTFPPNPNSYYLTLTHTHTLHLNSYNVR